MQTMVVHCIPGATLHAGNPVIVTSQVTNTMNADDLKQIHDLFNATFRPKTAAAEAQSVRNKRMVWCSNPNRDKLKSLKQAVATPLLNARQKMWVLGDKHYKRMPRVTVDVARKYPSLLNGHTQLCSGMKWFTVVKDSAPRAIVTSCRLKSNNTR